MQKPDTRRKKLLKEDWFLTSRSSFFHTYSSSTDSIGRRCWDLAEIFSSPQNGEFFKSPKGGNSSFRKSIREIHSNSGKGSHLRNTTDRITKLKCAQISEHYLKTHLHKRKVEILRCRGKRGLSSNLPPKRKNRPEDRSVENFENGGRWRTRTADIHGVNVTL